MSCQLQTVKKASNACMKLCHNSYRYLLPRTVRHILSTPLASAHETSVDLVRTQTKSTQAQGHSTMLHSPSGTGWQMHSKTQKTLHLFSGSSHHICFQLLSHPLASSSPSLDLFPTVPPESLSSQFPPLFPSTLPFSIISAKCRQHVAVCMESKLGYKRKH